MFLNFKSPFIHIMKEKNLSDYIEFSFCKTLANCFHVYPHRHFEYASFCSIFPV